MKALTLWQPHAQLVALGAKTIETRSWATKYRGPLAIHAAARTPEEGQVVGDWFVTERPTVTVGPPSDRLAFPGRWIIGAMAAGRADAHRLPLGAIVATCTLVDVVPMKAHTESTADHAAHLVVGTRHHPDRLLLARPSQGWGTNAYGVATHFEWATEVVTDQRPYGDYAPGRFAWHLADIEPLSKPIPARGRQGLWNWTPE